MATIVEDCAERAGFKAGDFSGHSLRAGFLTSAAEAGAGVLKLVEVSRHRSLDTMHGYVHSGAPSGARVPGFVLIWVVLALYSTEGLWTSRRRATAATA